MSFKDIQANIAKKQGIPMGNAGAILAATSRSASPAAKKKNPSLKKVKGKPDFSGAAQRLLGKNNAGK